MTVDQILATVMAVIDGLGIRPFILAFFAIVLVIVIAKLVTDWRSGG